MSKKTTLNIIWMSKKLIFEKSPKQSTADPFQVPKFEFACQSYKNGCRYVIKDFITSCYEIFLILGLNMGNFSRLFFVKSVIFFRFEMWNQFWECQPPESTTIFMWNIDIFFLVTIYKFRIPIILSFCVRLSEAKQVNSSGIIACAKSIY